MTLKSDKKTKEISLDISFAEELSKEILADLVVDLFRSLLHQRHQIPIEYSALRKEVREFRAKEEEVKGESPRIRRERIRKAKSRGRYLRKAGILEEEADKLAGDLRCEIIEKDLSSVSFIFGGSHVTPEEIYAVVFPEGLLPSSRPSISGQARRRFFRSLVTHQDLFSLLGKPLHLTNVFVAIKYKYLQPFNPLSFRPRFLGKKSPKSLVKFHFISPISELPLQTPANRKRPSHYTPVPMDLCTPFTITKSRRKASPYRSLPTSSVVKKLQAGFRSSAHHISEDHEDVEEVGDEPLESLSFLPEDNEEEEIYSKTQPLSSPVSLTSILDNHREKWFISSSHLRGIR